MGTQGQSFMLINKFHFSEVHRSMNTMGPMQSKWHPKGFTFNFAQDPLHSYFDQPHKNEIHLLYLHFVFTLFLFIICEVFIKILRNNRWRKVIN